MKQKYTRKEVRAMAVIAGRKVVAVSYCNLQHLLNYRSPFGYSSRSEGWACDYYDLDGVIVSTGYAPIGVSVGYELCRKYDEKAAKILSNRWSWRRQRTELDKLIAKFVEEVAQ